MNLKASHLLYSDPVVKWCKWISTDQPAIISPRKVAEKSKQSHVWASLRMVLKRPLRLSLLRAYWHWGALVLSHLSKDVAIQIMVQHWGAWTEIFTAVPQSKSKRMECKTTASVVLIQTILMAVHTVPNYAFSAVCFITFNYSYTAFCSRLTVVTN